MSDSARMRVSADVTVDAAGSSPQSERPKTLRPVLKSLTLPTDQQRTDVSNRRAALKLLQLREETGLTQVDAAALTADSSRTIRRYERAEVDLGPLRVFVELLEFRARQRGGK